jgi:diaminopimelate epimerase
LCDRKIGIGADGMLVLEKSKNADFRMRIFNPDGSEAEMCGNGLRCAILYVGMRGLQRHKDTKTQGHKDTSKKVRVETKAGIYNGEIVSKDRVKVRMEEPRDLRLNFPIDLNERNIKVNYVNTGVPHTVIFVEGIDKIDVEDIGRAVRFHEAFKPKGTNVNFVEIIDDNNIKIRTFERGVEGETLACGTGAVASAIITSYELRVTSYEINVHTRGGTLKVRFNREGKKIKDVYLEGEAKEVFTGQMRT